MNTIDQVRAQIRHLERDIEDKQGEICSAQVNIENFEYEASESEFDEFLDEIEGSITVVGMEFFPSDILKSCDPVAYRCAKSDFESDYDLDNCEEYSDLKDELEELEADLESLCEELEDLQDELDSLENGE